MKLEAITGRRAQVTVPVGDGEITVGYRPGGYDSEFHAALTNQLPVADALKRFAVDWDVTEEVDGKEQPAPIERLFELDMFVQARVWTAIVQDFFPNRETPSA